MFKRPLVMLTILFMISLLSIGCDNKDSTPTSDYQFISAQDLSERLSDKDFFFVDVHVPEQQHIIKTDAFIPYYDVKTNASRFPKDKAKEIIVYCLTNSMSIEASVELRSMGYENVKILDGGTTRWRELGYQFE